MAISEMTGPFDDDEREGPFDEEKDDTSPFDEEDTPFAEEEARENADEAFEDEDEAFQDEELPLADDEARLPWLEGDEDEDEYGGYSTGQTIVLVLAGLLVLGLVVGGIWWLTRPGPDTDLVADGSTIESNGPYKQRPENPGGKVFEGTGDSSFKVSEGQSNPARLGEAGSQPAPGFKTLGQGAEKPQAKPSGAPAAATSADTTGVGVQVGAYSDRASAETGWSRLSQQYGALKGLRHRVVEGQADIGTVYRLQAISNDASDASTLCNSLKASGLNCYVKR